MVNAYLDGFVCMAHRGGYISAEDSGRENSLYAFKKAVEIGYRHIETDVHATADGKLIAFHDDRLDRVTDRSGLVAKLPFSDVRKARIADTDQIPTLDEVLEEFPDTFINIDIKASSAIQPLVETIRRHKAINRVCVASFSHFRLAKFRRAKLGTLTSMSSVGVGVTKFCPPLTKIFDLGAAALQIPVCVRVAGKKIRLVTPKLLSNVHKRGIRIHIWTVNDPIEMAELIDIGVDGIITDRPKVLKDVAIAKGVWPG